VDLPSIDSHIANPTTLNLPDTLTEIDLFAPTSNLDVLLFGSSKGDLNVVGQTDEFDWGASQVLPDSLGTPARSSSQVMLENDDLGLDFGENSSVNADGSGHSIEIGRRQETPRRDNTLYDDDLGLDLGLDETTIRPYDNDVMPIDDVMMDDGTIGALPVNSQALDKLSTQIRHERSMSPLSEIGEEEAQDLERTFRIDLNGSNEQEQDEEEDELQTQGQQRAKRRKVMVIDSASEMRDTQVREQQQDHTKTLGHPQFLPRDPVLLALMQMQKSGAFISSILGDGMQRGWAPELRGVLSMEIVRRTGDAKRKRGQQDTRNNREPSVIRAITPAVNSPLPTIDHSDNFPHDFDMQNDNPDPVLDNVDEVQNPASPGLAAFDETTIAPIAPGESGPTSLGTKHTVHMLRERFSTSDDPDMPPSPSTRKTQSVLFTDLCPVRTTSRQDATQLFFETLVLATKDAIKVEQKIEGGLGSDLKLRAKRGLWGDWAVMGVNSQSQQAITT